MARSGSRVGTRPDLTIHRAADGGRSGHGGRWLAPLACRDEARPDHPRALRTGAEAVTEADGSLRSRVGTRPDVTIRAACGRGPKRSRPRSPRPEGRRRASLGSGRGPIRALRRRSRLPVPARAATTRCRTSTPRPSSRSALLDRLGLDEVWFSEHHFVEDGYLPSFAPVAGAVRR